MTPEDAEEHTQALGMSTGAAPARWRGRTPTTTTRKDTPVHTTDAYSQSIALVRHAVTAAARDAASLATANTPAAELLELLRLMLHRHIDDAIDNEELAHPSPHRLIARTPRYADLLAEVNGWE